MFLVRNSIENVVPCADSREASHEASWQVVHVAPSESVTPIGCPQGCVQVTTVIGSCSMTDSTAAIVELLERVLR